MRLSQARVLLAQSDPLSREETARMLTCCAALMEEADVSGVLERLRQRPADVLVCDFALRGGDALSLREALCGMDLISWPAMLVLLPEGLAQYTQTLYNNDVACVLPKGNIQALPEAVQRLRPCDRLTPDCARDGRIAARLKALSLRQDLAGYGYLLRAISLKVRCGDALTARAIYEEVARLQGGGCTKASVVERCIRHAVEEAWTRGDPGPQYRLFGNAIDESRGKPTNAELIARVAQSLRTEA